MKKYIAVFEVPDGYKPTDYLENADGWFTDEEGNRCTVGTKLEEAKQGEWIEKVERRGCFAGDKTVYSYTCPFCGVKEFKKYPFCHCGADMREGGAE